MVKIAIIIPYFGEWPAWTPLFLNSCRHNSTLDFFIFSDCDPHGFDKGQFPNIHLQRISFIDYCEYASQKLGLDFHPTRAYKLCDLKPYFGSIHSGILKDYGFWGFCDVDLVLGDLRSFYSEEVLKRYDVISNHSDRVSGHFALIRNSEKFVSMPFEIPNYQQMLSSDRNYAVDEIAFTKRIYPMSSFLWKVHKWIFLKLPFHDEFKSYAKFCSLFNRMMLPKRFLFQECFTTPWFGKETAAKQEVINSYQWEYKEGHVYDLLERKEIPYLHFLSLKRYWSPDVCRASEPCDHVIVNLTGICHA